LRWLMGSNKKVPSLKLTLIIEAVTGVHSVLLMNGNA
jgi:hypothetical protein